LSSPEVDGRDERRKVLIVINPRYGLRNLAIKPVGDLANALHIAGESLSAQRAGDGLQIFLWPRSFEDGLERIPEWLALWPATRENRARPWSANRRFGTSGSAEPCKLDRC
jgi:hypothetical protein